MPDDGCQLETLQANTLNNILQNLSQDHRKIVRDIEKLTRKQIKANFAVIFTSKCEQENLLPNSTNIYIYIYMSIFWEQVLFYALLVE